jgi:hypothetical protein
MNLRLLVMFPADSFSDPMKQELKLNAGSVWALANRKGFLLAQGEKAPTVQMLLKALEEDGIQSPIKVIKDFIKSNPDHLGARAQLLSLLRKYAESRTINLLQISLTNMKESDLKDSESYYHAFSGRMNLDFLPFQDKQLAEMDDLKIWGGYAQELDYLFRTGEWRLIFSINRREAIPAETCSPLMKSLYMRLLPQVEQALRERPSSPLSDGHWVTYAWMRSITGAKGSIKSLLDSMAPSPIKKTDWPPEEVFDIFGQEAKEQGNWGSYADLLWNRLDDVIHSQSTAPFRADYSTPIDPRRALVPLMDFIDPLLESLIRVSRIGDAEKAIMSLARFRNFSNLPKHSASIAEKCGRADLAVRWADLQVQPRPREAALEDLEALIYGATKYRPSLFYCNGISGDRFGIDTSSILDFATGLDGWELSVTFLDKEMSDLIMKRENWYGEETRWTLIGNDQKILASDTGAVTKEALIDALNEGRVEKAADKLRRFIREHPDHIEAKEELAQWLKKSAYLKTSEIFKDSQNAGKTTLAPDEDYMIWNEYATLFRQLANYYSGNVPSIGTYIDLFQNDEAKRRSPLMAALAKDVLPTFASNISRLPAESSFWTMWASWSDPQSSSQFNGLMEMVKLHPFENLDGILPFRFLGSLGERYRTNNNWQGIVNIFGDFLQDQQSSAGTPGYSFQRRYLYRIDSILLLEAYMNLNQESKTKELLELWKQSPNWKRDEADVKKLFEKYGRVL